jgi:hypothetical protein
VTSLYFPPKFDSGLAGAKLTFSITGTSTLQNTYTDEALTIAHSNPVVADAAGVFAPIYLDPTLPSYRVKFTTADDVTVYQVDDVPSNQNIQQSIRLEATNPFLFLYDTDGTSGSRKYRIRAAGAAFEVQAVNEAESVFTTILRYESGVLYSNETEVAVTESGSFTGTLTGMTATTSGTVKYRKVNNIATLWVEAQILGTSNTTVMSMTGIPASLTPSVGRLVISASGADSGAEVCLANNINASSEIIFATLDASVANLSPNGAFTNSGQKGLYNGWTITYAVA